jgi:rhamnogalacturonyl hydrolase YesR
MKTSQLLLGSSLNDYNFTNCRNCGWHLIHLSAAYRATGRRVFLNAARIIVERVLERQRESGGWDRLMVPGHCFCLPPRHRGNAGFMVGILMVGLKRFYEATGDPRVADSIVQAADYCIDTMWVPERSSFRYTCCPESSVGGSADMRILKGVATAYQFTGKKRFKDVLLAGVQSSMGGYRPRAHRGIGKGISSPMRGAPQVLVELPQTDGER